MIVDEILVSCVSISPRLPEGAKRRVISSALTRWLSDEVLAASDDITQAYHKALLAELRLLQNTKQEYTVLGFLNLNPERFTEVAPLNIRGHELNFLSWQELKDFDIAKLQAKAALQAQVSGQPVAPVFEATGMNGLEIRFMTFTPVLVKLQTYDATDAVSLAVEHIDLFRTTLNFAPVSAVLRHDATGRSSVNKYLPSPLYGAFTKEGDLLLDAYTPEYYGYIWREEVSEETFSLSLDLIQKLNSQSNDLTAFFVELLQLYQRALDFTDHRAMFLGLWQVLESAMLDEPAQKVRVDNRVTTFLRIENDQLLKEALNLLVQHRNTLVHSGLFPEYTSDLVFTLKRFVDSALHRILNLSNHLSNKNELREYLRYINVPRTDLERKRKVIELIQETR